MVVGCSIDSAFNRLRLDDPGENMYHAVKTKVNITCKVVDFLVSVC